MTNEAYKQDIDLDGGTAPAKDKIWNEEAFDNSQLEDQIEVGEEGQTSPYSKKKATYLRKKVTKEVVVEERTELFKANLESDSTANETTSDEAQIIEKLKHLIVLLTETKNCFENQCERQVFFSTFKRKFLKLYDWYLDVTIDKRAQALSYIYDSLQLESTRSENLHKEQIDILIKVLEICTQEIITVNDLGECDTLLLAAGIDTL